MRLLLKKKNYYLMLLSSISLFLTLNYFFRNNLYVGIYSFIFLSTIPGLLLYKIITRKLSFEFEHLLYYVGLSIFYLIFIGFCTNELLPVFGIVKPLEFYPLLISISVSLLLLIIFTYFTTQYLEYEAHFKLNVFKNILFFLPLLILLLLSIMGALSINNNGTNFFTLIMLLGICIYAAYLAFFKKDWDEWKYAVSIFSIALSILLMLSLRSWHITGWDINEEFEVFQITKNLGHWSTQNIQHDYNLCLSITILPTIFSRFLYIPDEYIYKVIYQIYFALVPVTLYFLFRRFAGKTMSFLAVFYFIAQPFFIQPMTGLARQEIAFLFFSLYLLATFAFLGKLRKELLLLVLGMSMVVTHYSTTYIAIVFFVFAYLLFMLVKLLVKLRNMKTRASFIKTPARFNLIIIAFLCLTTLAWYGILHTTSNSPYSAISQSLSNIQSSFGNDLKSSDVSETLSIFSTDSNTTSQKDINGYINMSIPNYNPSLYYLPQTYENYKPRPIQEQTVKPILNTGLNDQIINLLNLVKLITKLFILLGSFYYFYKSIKAYRFMIGLVPKEKEYAYLAFVALVSIVLFMVLPELSKYYNLTRLYLQSLMLLTLPGMIGGLAFLNLIFKRFSNTIFVSVLIIYFLYVSGFSTNILGGQAYMQLNNFGNDFEKFYVHETEIAGAKWLQQNCNKNIPIYADEVSNLRLFSFSLINNAIITIAPKSIKQDSYVYLRYANIQEERVDANYEGKHINFVSFPLEFLRENKNLIYNNGGSEIFESTAVP